MALSTRGRAAMGATRFDPRSVRQAGTGAALPRTQADTYDDQPHLTSPAHGRMGPDGRCGSRHRATNVIDDQVAAHSGVFARPKPHLPFRRCRAPPVTVCSSMLSPSSISATSNSSERWRRSYASSSPLVVDTNRRLAALLLATGCRASQAMARSTRRSCASTRRARAAPRSRRAARTMRLAVLQKDNP